MHDTETKNYQTVFCNAGKINSARRNKSYKYSKEAIIQMATFCPEYVGRRRKDLGWGRRIPKRNRGGRVNNNIRNGKRGERLK